MTSTPVPIPLVLDLWSIGHSASDIAKRLDIPGGHKGVTRIVAHARSIGDKRAVLHCGENGRLLGRPGRTGRKVSKLGHKVAGKEVVELVPKPPRPTIPLCRRGHVRTERGECKACKKITDRLRYEAVKGIR